MAQLNCKQSMNQNYGVGSSQSGSTSQPAFLANHTLPPLSPLPHSESSWASSSSVKDVSMDEVDVSSRGRSVKEVDVSSRGSSAVGQSFSNLDSTFRGNFESLPPRNGHRRSSSDVPLGFNVMIQASPQLVPISGRGALAEVVCVNDRLGRDKSIHLQKKEIVTNKDCKSNVNSLGDRRLEGEDVNDLFRSYMRLDNADRFNSSGTEDKDKGSMVNGTRKGGDKSSNSEVESISKRISTRIDGIGLTEGIKRSATGDIAPTARHFRSLSVDSAFGSLHFSEESPRLPTSVGNRVGQSNLVTENLSKFSLEFGNGEFSEADIKKIMSDERLTEIALSDPKRAKRVLANRQSAARSKERKLRYISELERKVQTLQTKATTLSAQLTVLQKDLDELTNQNNELKFRLQAMEQQARLRDALHETLTAEVQRLKFAAAELGDDDGPSSYVTQQLPRKQHHQSSQLQELSAATSKIATTASATPSLA